jgi:hypothetical protein
LEKEVSNKGEISKTNQLFSNQIAPSIRELLDLPQKKRRRVWNPDKFELINIQIKK